MTVKKWRMTINHIAWSPLGASPLISVTITFGRRHIKDKSWWQIWLIICALQLCCLNEDLKTNIWAPSSQKVGIFYTPYWLPFRLMITRATVVLKMCMQFGWTLMEMMESGIDASHWIVNTKSPLLWDNVNLIQRHLLFLNINLSSRYVSIASFFNCHDHFQNNFY